MNSRFRSPAPRRLLGVALVLAVLVPAVLAAGPPWITIEYPPNPLDPETRGALAVVHTYHHAAGVDATLTARAVSLVDGERRTVPLEVVATSSPATYAVRGRLDDRAAWVVVIDMKRGEAFASALVALDRGVLSSVRVPHHMQGSYPIPHAATAEEVDAMLADAVTVAQARREARVGQRETASRVPGPALAGLLIGLVPVGLLLHRRVRAR